MITRNGGDFTLAAGNKIYEGGNNGTLLGFFATSSYNESPGGWTNAIGADFGNDLSPSTTHFPGWIQEIRYYSTPIKNQIFKDYIMNPYSIEGNTFNNGFNELAFRASLGGELYAGSVSIHPKVTGSWVITSSFVGNSDFTFSQPPTFTPNTEYFFYGQPIAGIKNAVSDFLTTNLI